MYVYIYICMMIYSDISVIFIYIYTIHRLFIGFLLTLQIGFPPTKSRGKSEPFVPVLYNPCGRSVKVSPSNQPEGEIIDLGEQKSCTSW